jgi:UDP-glucose 4-epimerase
MRAFVTGATGFVGRALTANLIAQGWDICCLVRKPVNPVSPRVTALVGDLAEPGQVSTCRTKFGAIDAIFHLAAMMPAEGGPMDPRFVEVNAAATLRLLAEAETAEVPRFVYLSSISVIGEPKAVPISETHPLRPRHAYALGKLGGEQACALARERGLHATALRLSSPYGPDMPQGSVLPTLLSNALAGRPVRWHGSGIRSQDFVHVDDVAEACRLAAMTPNNGTFMLGSGVATTMRGLAMLIADLVPGAEAMPSSEADPQEGVAWQLDISAARAQLGYQPKIGLREGIAGCISGRENAARQWWNAA